MGTLSVTVYPDAADFLRAAGPFLRAAPAEHNLILSIAEAAADGPVPPGGPTLLASVEAGGRVVGASFRTPPHKLGLTRMPAEAAPALAAAVGRRYDDLPAVFGPDDAAQAFARAWAALRGETWAPGEAQRIYRLDRVEAPGTVSGGLRVADAGDRALVARWCAGFAADLGPEFQASEQAQAGWLESGAAFLWDDDGPVSMAVGLGFTSGGARVGYVYTPPEHRGRGYASALTAAVSQTLMDGGRDYCVLYARLSDPVSNRIYRRIGYRPVADVLDIRFSVPRREVR